MTFHRASAMAANISSPSPATASLSLSKEAMVPWDRVERFTSQVIHDVRNGLNALELQLTFLGEISTDPEASAEVKRLRETLGNVTRHLQSLKVAVSAPNPHRLDYPAADFFEDLRERVERRHPDAASKVSWSVSLDVDDSVMVDPDLTINGLLEIFSNAFRFSSAAVRCTVVVGDSQHVSFVLEETPSSAPMITPERWGREPLVTTARGTYGLGLFRARRILEAQGGVLDIVYLSAGNLLRTSVSLPRSSEDPS